MVPVLAAFLTKKVDIICVHDLVSNAEVHSWSGWREGWWDIPLQISKIAPREKLSMEQWENLAEILPTKLTLSMGSRVFNAMPGAGVNMWPD